jgi:hypothetical protein
VGKVRFLCNDSHLVSIGRGDRCVFQWRFEEDDELDDADVVDESETEGYKADMKVPGIHRAHLLNVPI